MRFPTIYNAPFVLPGASSAPATATTFQLSLRYR